MNNVLYFVVQFLMEIVCFGFMARFLLQACQADFYNPISQGIVKATDPILRPLRAVVPAYRNLDLAAIPGPGGPGGGELLVRVLGGGWVGGGPRQGSTGSLLHILLRFLDLFWWSILIVIIASFLAQGRYHPALQLLHQITEPILAPARRIIPPMGGLDFSPILVILLLGILQRILPQLFGAVF
ncbi:MAG: YggT family protein [Gammaproteobacteria bacterium]|nr:YggT family protein [Gammaproteobacteria bacterium]